MDRAVRAWWGAFTPFARDALKAILGFSILFAISLQCIPGAAPLVLVVMFHYLGLYLAAKHSDEMIFD